MHFGSASNTIEVPEFGEQSSLAAQFERAKEELELVSYVTSHDLLAPLRNILYACEEVNDHSNLITVNEARTVALEKVSNEASRMKVLVQGLLDYLRLETFGPARTLLDANEIVSVALTILEEKIHATSAKITYDPLPHIYGHRGRLTRLFVNLLDNALKFHDQPPVIHISAHSNEYGTKFCIADNGIGIDEEYHEIIFQLFQRLHTADVYPGDGIGLALSKKIVESHGGKIWVESVPKAGSRFQFTLPASQNN